MLDRASFQLQITIFYHHWLCIFTSNQQEKTCEGYPLFTAIIVVSVVHLLFVQLCISFCDLTAVLNVLVTYIAVANAEMNCPPPNCAHFHCLVSVNFQQTLMKCIAIASGSEYVENFFFFLVFFYICYSFHENKWEILLLEHT